MDHPERITIETCDERYHWLNDTRRGCVPCLSGPFWPVILLAAWLISALIAAARRLEHW